MALKLDQGVLAALASAMLFGAGAPLAKDLLGAVGPWLLAALLYLGSGFGLSLYRLLVKAPGVRLTRQEMVWFACAVITGGMIGPVLLMVGLQGMSASGTSLLLNAEAVFTTLLAWFAFKENFDRRIALGMLAILAGSVVLSWPSGTRIFDYWSALAVLGACLAWGIDNNLTRKVALHDATWIAMVKGIVAGSANLALAIYLGTTWPAVPAIAASMCLGFFSYGVSLTLFVLALRHLGTARAGAYFSVAPFFGAGLALAMGDSLTPQLLLAAVLMGCGIWLHLTERHAHEHTHTALDHDHEHEHDAHHQHEHDDGESLLTRHRHSHRHQPLTHDHPHFPDAHHRH